MPSQGFTPPSSLWMLSTIMDYHKKLRINTAYFLCFYIMSYVYVSHIVYITFLQYIIYIIENVCV